MSPSDFLNAIDTPELTAIERIHAILWITGQNGVDIGMTVVEISKIIEGNGHPKQNLSRLKQKIEKDSYISKVPGSKEAWRLNLKGKTTLDQKFETVITLPKKVVQTDSILPRSLFQNTRSYIEKVVVQINGSYDNGLYDCCAVMSRRLLETLIIEIYENLSKSHEIKDPEGNFFMFANLLKVFENDKSINISRNGKQGLVDFKKLGDLSAHNRRFNARKEDIDRIQGGLRVATEELLHLAKLV